MGKAADTNPIKILERYINLIIGIGIAQKIAVFLYCHMSVAILCLNVAFDLFVFGFPMFLSRALGFISDSRFKQIMDSLINWTTPIVFSMPMIFSGCQLYCDNIELLQNSKEKNSLLLANHGSRIDWMIGMFCGYTKKIANRNCNRIRVSFVCEAFIQFMPIIGWYRKLVCEDVFVWRSFLKDSPTIKANISNFHRANVRRMLFLSPEGIIVDFKENDRSYIKSCREFCIKNGYKPFNYVLTPRYKGTTCLLDHVRRDDTSLPIEWFQISIF